MKIAINTCYGGFSLSKKACKELGLKSGYDSIERNNPKLIEVIEKLGKDGHQVLDKVDVDSIEVTGNIFENKSNGRPK